MRIGIIFPTTEIGTDMSLVRDMAQTAEGLGFTHIIAYDHVLGADQKKRGRDTAFYGLDDPFHEPFVLFGYLAAITSRIELTTSVIILPQRQTALVAKQATQVDIMSGGRLRLGVGTGWNDVEYEALGQDFHTRGRRLEEQVHLLRRLWSEREVEFEGEFDRIPGAGILPLPVRRNIPIWMGGGAEAAVRRAARIGDGWFPLLRPDDRLKALVEQARGWVAEAGRDPAQWGLEGRINLHQDPARWLEHRRTWEDMKASHMTLNTLNMGLKDPGEHLALFERYAKEVGLD